MGTPQADSETETARLLGAVLRNEGPASSSGLATRVLQLARVILNRSAEQQPPAGSLSLTTPSPSASASSPTATAVSSMEDSRVLPLRSDGGAQETETWVKALLVLLARLAAFSDVFLSGLVIPLIPTILEHRVQVPQQQVQIWTSVLISAYGGALAVISPLIPLLTRHGPLSYVVLLGGLACSAAAFSLLQSASGILELILARAVHGFAAAAITGSSAGLFATVTTAGPTWLSPAFLQHTAMTGAPLIAGFLTDHFSLDAIFFCAYALVTLNMLLTFVVGGATSLKLAGSVEETTALLGPDSQQGGGYGTMASGSDGFSSRRSSRSVSPTTIPARRSRLSAPAALPAGIPWSPRLVGAFGGYLAVNFLTSALQSVLPLFVERRFHWSALETGYMFVPLSAPTALIGVVTGVLATRVPGSTHFLTSAGFLACVPAFLYLGQLRGHSWVVQQSFLLTLSGISFATGLCGDPMVREIGNALSASSAGDPRAAAAMTTVVPHLAVAWGGLIGPLFAGAVNYLWGWQTMNKSMAIVAGGTSLASLLYVRGYLGNSPSNRRSHVLVPGRPDEESGSLLAKGKEGGYAHRHGSTDSKPRSHRRHFSVDNFSVANTTGPGSVDSSTSSVRFQASLETPVSGPTNPNPKRSISSDAASKASNSERRYVMREAPHAPATDPFLAAGSLYVIDEERNTAHGVESRRKNRRVVVFPEGTAPPELLERHRHHVVAINALDGSAQMVSNSTENHAVHVTEEDGDDEDDLASEVESSRRYVVVVVEGEEAEE
ncbi:major facilitator superfamily domain-containing protein [Chaetomium sp. MPI-SDFR-AT-0129]|nr:major facilitator superfamily domain-containing protein [Chaetomium sp. MPI-SDFR-AT-0129]